MVLKTPAQMTVGERVEDLERSAYRTLMWEDRVTGQLGAVSERLDHLSGAVDTLSQDARALAHEVRAEVLPRLDRLDGRMDRLEVRMGRLELGMRALLDHFGLTAPSPDGE